jgi:hypothetical protein
MSSGRSMIPPIGPMLPSDHIKTVWNHLQKEHQELSKEAKSDQTVAASVFLFGGAEIAVETFGYAGPNLLIVNGQINGKDITAYVHQSCLQVVFALVPKDSNASRGPLGFINPSPTEEDHTPTE